MIIEKTPRYNRTVKKIIKSHKLTKEIIEDTENLFTTNPYEPSLYWTDWNEIRIEFIFN